MESKLMNEELIKDIWIIVTSVITVASVIVKFTPTKTDDNILLKIIKLLSLNKSDPKM